MIDQKIEAIKEAGNETMRHKNKKLSELEKLESLPADEQLKILKAQFYIKRNRRSFLKASFTKKRLISLFGFFILMAVSIALTPTTESQPVTLLTWGLMVGFLGMIIILDQLLYVYFFIWKKYNLKYKEIIQ